MTKDQARAVFDSLDIPVSMTDTNIFRFNKDQMHLAAHDDCWWKDDPPTWEIFAAALRSSYSNRVILTTVTDEFELQDWLINNI